MNERFSIIVLVYNNDQYLRECLDSILNQIYNDVEILIADDHSKTFDMEYYSRYIAENMGEGITNYCVYQNPENYGTVKSINIALTKATGKYIKLLAADDALYDKNVLVYAKEYLDKSEKGIILGDIVICDDNLEPTGKESRKFQKTINMKSPEECFVRLCIKNEYDAQGIFFKASFFQKYGAFDENYRLLEDWPKWLEIALAGIKPLYAPFLAAKYRSDCGNGTGINPLYLSDKEKVLNAIIIPEKERIGLINYIRARIMFIITTSQFVRRVYGIVRKKKTQKESIYENFL